MSSIAASLQPVPRRQYVSTGIFTANFFTYGKAAVVNGVQRYALTQVSDDDNDCPKGHILRENGRKLIKDVNIDLNDPNTTANEYTYLVGVIDTTADPAVAGFIDPNCPVFTAFNTDKPYFLDSPMEAEDAATGLQDIGAPVYTRGDITTTAGNITATAGDITATAGDITATAGRITAGGSFIRYRSIITYGGNSNVDLGADPQGPNKLIGNVIVDNIGTTNLSLTLPSTADIVSTCGGVPGYSFDFIAWNSGASNLTITPATNTTIVGSPVLTAAVARFTGVVSSNSPTPALIIYRA
jgi:hypothetical protein